MPRFFDVLSGCAHEERAVTWLKIGRWTATAIFLAAGSRLAFRHHDATLGQLTAATAFHVLICAWIVMILLSFFERHRE
jgi:hypothetical protein